MLLGFEAHEFKVQFGLLLHGYTGEFWIMRVATLFNLQAQGPESAT